MTFTKENPRFIWNIGAIGQLYPDLPDQQGPTELIDRLTARPVMSITAEWSNAICLGLPIEAVCA